MSVYELNATKTMSDSIAVPEPVKSTPEGRNWGKIFVWSALALVVAGALAGGGWLAYRAGQQAGATGGVTASGEFGQRGAVPPGALPGMMTNRAARAAGVADAQADAVGAAPVALEAAPSAADSGNLTGGLGSVRATAVAQGAVTINTRASVLEQSTTRATSTNAGQATIASIPAIVATSATPLLSDTGAALASLDSGDSLRATARSADSQWLAVQSDAAGGWVARDAVIAYGLGNLATLDPPAAVRVAAANPAKPADGNTVALVLTGPDAEAILGAAPVASITGPARTEPSAMEATVATSAANLNVRAGPGTQYAVVAKAAKGATVTPTARNATADWLKVRLESGESGWTAAAYLNVIGDVQSLPVEAAAAVPLPATPSGSAASSTKTAAASSAAAVLLSGKLAFQQSAGGTIWTYDFASGETRSLTSGFDPAMSPDGRTIAFVREGGEAGLYLIDSDGGNERLIFGERGRLSAPKWSEDGKWILLGRGDEYYECYPMGQNECLTEDELDKRFPRGAPPDLVLEKRYFDKLSVVDIDGNNFHDIPSLTSAKAADWANGDIVYQSSAGLQRTADGTSDVNRRIIFEPLMTQFQDPDWQPGGSVITFQKKGAAQWDIWAVNADGSNMHGLTKAVTTLVDKLPSNVAPAFSPDGAQIVYLSNRTESNEAGDWRLWVMDADGSNARALPIDVPITYTYGVEQVVSWGG